MNIQFPKLVSIIAASFFIGGALAQAANLPLATITTDAIQGAIVLYGQTADDGSLIDLNYTKPNENPSHFPIADLKDGIVLFATQGQNVVVLHSDHFDAKTGGAVTMTYLFNGITGRHHDYALELDRAGDVWTVYANDSAGRRAFTKMFLKANKVWGQIVGIASVTVE